MANAAHKREFDQSYRQHLKHLKLKGLRPKTIEAYARAIRRIGKHFDFRLDSLSEQQLIDYFSQLLDSHSWTTTKVEFYGLKFFYLYVLRKPWTLPDLIKPPRPQRLPDIVTVDEMRRIIASTRVLSYKVFFFTLYSLGLRLGEGLRLQVADIDAERARVHVRDAKGNKDRFVPLPHATLRLLRGFWKLHRNHALLFPNRASGLNGAAQATTPLDRGGVQTTLVKVVRECGIKKRSRPTAFDTPSPRT
jgi:integrase/recombinase XerD